MVELILSEKNNLLSIRALEIFERVWIDKGERQSTKRNVNEANYTVLPVFESCSYKSVTLQKFTY